MKLTGAILLLLVASTPGQVLTTATPAFDPDAYLGQKSASASSTPTPLDLRPVEEKTPTEIARLAFPSVVLLVLQDARGQPLSLGSGFFVEKDIVATNFHVIDGASSGFARIIGRPTKLTIEGIVGLDAARDLVLLQLAHSAAPPLEIAPESSVSVGDPVFAVGNPRGLEGTFSQGIVSSVREFGSDRLLQVTAPISPGSSGGPVLDRTAAVIGVSVASITNGQNLNFAIPADYVKALQTKETKLQSFNALPKSKSRTTLLGRAGSEKPRTGVVGENFKYEHDRPGGFSLSLHNKLSQDVATINGFAIFYGPENEPLDTVSISYQGIIPAHMAKRIKSEVDMSVVALSEAVFSWDAKGRVWRKLDSPWDLSKLPRGVQTEVRKGKVEFRILDYTISDE
jgi:hypothetical protein